jgi:hypothetical protein
VWNRQDALRLQRQVAPAEKSAERERKLQHQGVTEQLIAELDARVAQCLLRNDEFPPLDLDTDGVGVLDAKLIKAVRT